MLFDKYRDWLKYSINAGVAQGGGNVFSTKKYINWYKKISFATHFGPPN